MRDRIGFGRESDDGRIFEGKIDAPLYSLLPTLPMNHRSTLALALLTCLASAHAENAADLTPVLAKPGQAVVEESFDGAVLGKDWSAAKGAWEPRDGVLVGQEKKEDKHAAVLSFGRQNRDSIVRFAFKLDGAKSMSLSLNAAKGGHLFRVSIAPESVTLLKDRDKKDPASKSMPLAKADTKCNDGKWHTLLVEIQGADVAVQTDHGVKLKGSHPTLEVDKTGYRLVTAGASLLVDDVKVWDVAK